MYPSFVHTVSIGCLRVVTVFDLVQLWSAQRPASFASSRLVFPSIYRVPPNSTACKETRPSTAARRVRSRSHSRLMSTAVQHSRQRADRCMNSQHAHPAPRSAEPTSSATVLLSPSRRRRFHSSLRSIPKPPPPLTRSKRAVLDKGRALNALAQLWPGPDPCPPCQPKLSTANPWRRSYPCPALSGIHQVSSKVGIAELAILDWTGSWVVLGLGLVNLHRRIARYSAASSHLPFALLRFGARSGTRTRLVLLASHSHSFSSPPFLPQTFPFHNFVTLLSLCSFFVPYLSLSLSSLSSALPNRSNSPFHPLGRAVQSRRLRLTPRIPIPPHIALHPPTAFVHNQEPCYHAPQSLKHTELIQVSYRTFSSSLLWSVMHLLSQSFDR